MPPVRLADTRTTPSIEDAERIMSQIRKLTCEREIIIARAEKKIALITSQAETQTRHLDNQLDAAGEQMKDFILANRSMFRNPRRHKTPDGDFGMRTASKLNVDDADQALNHVLESGYFDCMKVTRKLVKARLRARIEDGEDIPGCHISRGEVADYTVNKALVERARQDAKPL